jgi:LacI family transcriptional regulator
MKIKLHQHETGWLHQEITEQIRSQIKSGQLQPGDRLPSYNEIRASHGIHTNTMEKVLARLEQDGLVERRRGTGVFVLQPKPRKVNGIIGLSGSGFNFTDYSPYWAQLQGGVSEAAEAAGSQLLMLNPYRTQGWEKADGVLVCDWNDPRTRRKSLPGQPMVSLLTPIPNVASVFADDENGAFTATNYLLQQGHRRISFLHGYEDHTTAISRIAGYRRALRESGITPRKTWMRRLRGHYLSGQQFTSEARKNTLLWLRDGWEKTGCTALLCHNDEAAMGAIAALDERGIRVPQDISVVGFDGTEYCDLVRPRLSSVEVPLRRIGAVGVELLIDQIAQDKVSTEHKLLPTRFKVRESTGVPLSFKTCE